MKLYTYNHTLAESVWWNLLLLTLGSLLMTVCIQSVAAPHDFLAGGVMGVALLIAYWTDTLTPLLWYMLVCLPVYAGGWFFVGRRFLLYTAYGTLFIRGRYKTMILSASGQNIYPEEIEAKLNNMPFVAESLVVDRDGKLVGLVYPDYEAVDKLGISISDMDSAMENVRKELNKIVAPYEQLAKIILMPNEFEKTPKRSIKRYLYTR